MTDRTSWQIAAAAVVLRLAVVGAAVAVAGTTTLHAPDTASYLEPAVELLADGTFTRGGQPEIVRTPGYPLLLVPGLAAGALEAVTAVLQALLAGATVLAIYTLTRDLFTRRAAVMAATLWALEPLSILYAGRLLSETLFTAALTIAVAALARALSRRDGVEVPAALSGTFFAIAILTRPIAYPLALFGASCLGWAAASQRPSRGRWLAVMVFVLLSIGPPLAWQARNMAAVGYTRLAAIVDVNAYFYHGAATQAAVDGDSFYDRQRELGYRDLEVYLARHPEQRDWTPAQRFEWMGRQGLRTVLTHPLTSFGIYVRGLARVLLDPGGTDSLRLFGAYPQRGGMLGRLVDAGLWSTLVYAANERPGLIGVEAMFGLALLALYGLGAWGLRSQTPNHRVAALVCLAVAGYLLLASGGPFSLSRFRHPIMPLVCVFAGAGLASWRPAPGAGGARL